MHRRRQRGVALLLALLAVAIVALVSAQTLQAGAQVTRREAEEELLNTGRMLQQALKSYVNQTPGPASLGPRSMDELLRDPRVPGVRRHLRQLPVDPLTGKFEWGLIRSPDGQIVGIHSLAEGAPIKQTGFEPELARLSGATSYQSWIFGAVLPIANQRPPAPASNPQR